MIRRGTESDCHAYKALRDSLDGEYQTWGADSGERYPNIENARKEIRGINSSRNSGIWFATKGESFIGFVIVKGARWRRTCHGGEVTIGIKSEYWGKGISDALFDTIERWCAESGVFRLELFVSETNKRAFAFYKRHGYKVEGVRHSSIFLGGKLYNEIWMYKLLNGSQSCA